MPKFLLVNPRPLDFELLEGISIPFSVLYLGTWLKHHGFEVEVIDGLTQPSSRIFEERVIDGCKDAVACGFSVMTPHVKDALYLSRKIKATHPHCAVLWGGIHPTLFPDSTLADPSIDFVMYGEGEDGILAMARELKKESPDFSSVPGIGYKVNGKTKLTAFRTTVDVNKLPFPEYALLQPFEPYLMPKNLSYHKYSRSMHRLVAIHCGRGCPYDCTFCINTVYDNALLRRHRAFDAEKTYEEMKWFKETHGVDYFSLQDELFFVNRPRLEKLVGLLEEKPLNICWDTNPRVNYFNEAYIDDKFLRRLRDTGFFNFTLAVESGSDRVIQILHKNILREQAIESIVRVKKYDMAATAGFMIGIPGEEIEDMYKSLKLGIELYTAVKGEIGFIGPQVFRPYPGAGLFEIAKKMGLTTPNNLEDWATIAVNPMFGFLDLNYLPWLDAEKRRHINFIIKYFTVVLGCKFDRTLFKLPLRMMLVAIPLHLLLKLRVRFNILDKYWFIERTILNALTPLQTFYRRMQLMYRRSRRLRKEAAEKTAVPVPQPAVATPV